MQVGDAFWALTFLAGKCQSASLPDFCQQNSHPSPSSSQYKWCAVYALPGWRPPPSRQNVTFLEFRLRKAGQAYCASLAAETMPCLSTLRAAKMDCSTGAPLRLACEGSRGESTERAPHILW
uniref:Ig-like domain-containing protein n=1 Tax=Trichuris muris TaxID=70415 RepID=A0A5S6QI56_TRIMR